MRFAHKSNLFHIIILFIMKRIFLAVIMAVVSLGAFAQFEKGTKYVNLSLSGLDMSYSKNTDFNLGLDATAGYFLDDCWMLMGRVGYNHTQGSDSFNLGAAGRYYILQNGIYLGLGAKFDFQHAGGADYHNIYLTPEVGYCFYLNHYLSVEPAVYYDMSLNHLADASKIGLRVGFGFYF